ncbi:MAG TPA: hypothetical protein PLX56_12310 [bacterium]|nr:hypothetical protein [bacterium]
MKNIITTISIFTVAISFVLPCEASLFSSVGRAVTKKVAGEVMEEGTEKLLKKVASEIGETSAKKILSESGEEGLEFVVKHGVKGADFISKFGKAGLRAAMSEGAERTIKLAGIYGDDVIEIAAKHPGTGLKIVEELGETGLKIAKHSDSLTVNQTLRYLPEMTEKGLRNKYLSAVEREGAGLFKRAGRWVADNPFKTAGLGAGLYFAIDPEGFAKYMNKGVMPVAEKGAEAAGTFLKEIGKGAGEGAGSLLKNLVPEWAVITAFFGTLLMLFILFSKAVSSIKNFFGNLFGRKVPEKRKEEDFKTSERI